MTEGQKYPNSMDGWLELLLPKKVPSAVNTAKSCLNAMQESDLSYHQLADRLANDPVIALRIMSDANRDPDRADVFSKTLDNAMSMIGIKRLEDLLEGAPLLPENYGYRAFYRTLDQSLTKAHLAKEFAAQKMPEKQNDVFWGSLFSDAALWYLWCFATPLMRQWESLHPNKKTSGSEDIFGCNIKELQIAILEHTSAPELAIQANTLDLCLSAKDWVLLAKAASINPDSDTSLIGNKSLEELPRELKIAKQSPLFIIELAGLYLHYLRKARNANQMSRAISIASAGLNLHADKVHHLTTQCLLSYSRSVRFPFCSSPASILFNEIGSPEPQTQSTPKKAVRKSKPPSAKPPQSMSSQTPQPSGMDPSIAGRSAETVADTPKTKQATQESFKASANFVGLMAQLKEHPDSFSNANDLMGKTIRVLVDGLGLKRGIIALIDKDANKLKVYYKHGLENDDPLAKFESPLISSTVFKILSEKPAALWVKPSASKSIADLVPLNFKQLTQSDEGLFMSVFIKQRPVAIVYVDNGSQDDILEAQFRLFKLMNKALEKALVELRSKKSK